MDYLTTAEELLDTALTHVTELDKINRRLKWVCLFYAEKVVSEEVSNPEELKFWSGKHSHTSKFFQSLDDESIPYKERINETLWKMNMWYGMDSSDMVRVIKSMLDPDSGNHPGMQLNSISEVL